MHDCNQRHILLYGVGKAREEARHTVKKMVKEVGRLFHKKLAIDVQAEGTSSAGGLGAAGSSKSRKHSSRIEFNFELTMQRFLGLSYFDRHQVTAQVAQVCLEMLSGGVGGGGGGGGGSSSSSGLAGGVGAGGSAGCAAIVGLYLPILEHVSFLFDLFEVCADCRFLSVHS